MFYLLFSSGTVLVLVTVFETKHFCFILSMGTKIRIDSVMHPRSSSREHNTSASVGVTVTVSD